MANFGVIFRKRRQFSQHVYIQSQGNVFPDNERREYYRSVDYPATSCRNSKEQWKFKIDAVDTCNKNKVVSSIHYTIDWS